jgi:hypothetical protein
MWKNRKKSALNGLFYGQCIAGVDVIKIWPINWSIYRRGNVLGVDISEGRCIGVDILGVDLSLVDILGVDVLGGDVLR